MKAYLTVTYRDEKGERSYMIWAEDPEAPEKLGAQVADTVVQQLRNGGCHPITISPIHPINVHEIAS